MTQKFNQAIDQYEVETGITPTHLVLGRLEYGYFMGLADVAPHFAPITVRKGKPFYGLEVLQACQESLIICARGA